MPEATVAGSLVNGIDPAGFWDVPVPLPETSQEFGAAAPTPGLAMFVAALAAVQIQWQPCRRSTSWGTCALLVLLLSGVGCASRSSSERTRTLAEHVALIEPNVPPRIHRAMQRGLPAQRGLFSRHMSRSTSVRENLVIVLDSTLAEQLEALKRADPEFAAMMQTFESQQYPVWIGTYENFGMEQVRGAGLAIPLHSTLDRSSADGHLVLIDLLSHERAVSNYQNNWMHEDTLAHPELFAGIDRDEVVRELKQRLLWVLLYHEIKHAESVAAQEGDMRALCDDPNRDALGALKQQAADSCIMKEENRLRTRLGLGQRAEYSVGNIGNEMLDYLRQRNQQKTTGE